MYCSPSTVASVMEVSETSVEKSKACVCFCGPLPARNKLCEKRKLLPKSAGLGRIVRGTAKNANYCRRARARAVGSRHREKRKLLPLTLPQCQRMCVFAALNTCRLPTESTILQWPSLLFEKINVLHFAKIKKNHGEPPLINELETTSSLSNEAELRNKRHCSQGFVLIENPCSKSFMPKSAGSGSSAGFERSQ